MRQLVFLALGFGAGCASCAYAQFPAMTWLFTALIAVMGVLVLAVGFWVSTFHARKIGLVLLGLAVGLFWFQVYQRSYLALPESMDGETKQVTIRASDFSWNSRYGSTLDGTVRLGGKAYKVRTYLNRPVQVIPGTQITGKFRLRSTAANKEREATYHPGEGIFLLAYEKDSVTFSYSQPTWREIPAFLRLRIKTAISDSFPADTQGFAKALMLGDTTALDYETDTALKTSGIRHVAAVSGMHVSMLFALISMVSLRKRIWNAILGIPCLILFAALVGFTPSVVRACMMAGLMLIASVANREYDAASALAFAVLVMLVVNPLAVTSVGLQLSVSSVSGILLFGEAIYNWIVGKIPMPERKTARKKAVRWLALSVSSSLGSCLLTTPLCAWYFGTVSLIGPLTNLLTLWVISFVFYGIAAVCLLSAVAPSLGAVLGGLIAWPIRYVLFLARTLSDFPLACGYTYSANFTAWLIFVYLLLFGFLLCRKKRPMAFLCTAVVALVICVLTSWAGPANGSVQMTVLDVGQGQCILIRSEHGCYMVDCGGESETGVADLAAQALLSQGIFQLDGLILTHYDWDHMGAAENLLTRVPTKALILPGPQEDGKGLAASRMIYVQKDISVMWHDIRIDLYAPELSEKSNERSICVLFDTKKCDILITGDQTIRGEEKLLGRTDLKRVDVLIAGHHGGKDATGEALLKAVRPKIACISVGADNAYGHPSQETLDRLKRFGCDIYRTDRDGTITIWR